MVRAKEALQILEKAVSEFFVWREQMVRVVAAVHLQRAQLSDEGKNAARALGFVAQGILPASRTQLSTYITKEHRLWETLRKAVEGAVNDIPLMDVLLAEPALISMKQDLLRLRGQWVRTYDKFDSFPPVEDARPQAEVRVDKTRSARLVLVLNPSGVRVNLPKEYKLQGYDYLLEACLIRGVSWKEMEGKILSQAVAALEKALGGFMLERYLGPAWKTTVTLYIFAQAPHASGFVSRMWRMFHGRKIAFSSMPNDIRFFIEAEELLNTNAKTLADIFVHEMTHALDSGMDWLDRGVLREIRNEGLARFAEVVEAPERLLVLWTRGGIALGDLVVEPFTGEERLTAALKDPDNKYTVGLGVMMQLFLASIHRDDAFADVKEMERLVRVYRVQAGGIVNVFKGLNEKKFFRYYAAKVQRPLFARVLLERA